ncbi:armadillo repeat-containing protein 3 [Oryzias latipes]|uniref:Armadillo repeat containing 3 n=1 Tax=Oryzias latipes TaxID=8090 RepID=H2L3D2_ORYLA|nr:armadillo repeat-containing protein 3 [Oryzias latipes]
MTHKTRKDSEPLSKDKFGFISIESKSPETAVLLLNSPEEEVIVKACDAIFTFAEKGDENKLSLLGLGALEPLIRLLSHSSRAVRRGAVVALGSMAVHGEVKNALKKLNAIPSILEKLSPEEETVVHEFATLSLTHLSKDFSCKAQMFDSNGLPPLIQLLSSPDPDVKKNSVEVIYNLVQDYKSRLAFHKLGGIPSLLELLKSDFPVIQHLALGTLQCVTTDPDSRRTFREEQGFDRLMDVLSNPDFSDLHAAALQTLSNCLSDSQTVKLVHKSRGLARLLHFLMAPNAPGVQSAAVDCLTKVAQSAESLRLLHEEGTEKVLAELLSVDDIGVKTSACQAVAAMSFHPASKDIFRDLGVVPALTQLLRRQSLMLRAAATRALYGLSHGDQLNALSIYNTGGHEILVQQLHEACPKTVASSAATLYNMAAQEAIRSSIVSHGAMQALAEALKSKDTEVLLSSTLCVAELACEEEARAELRRAGGLEALVRLLHSPHEEVWKNACFAVKVCASDKPSAVEMCRLGALEILQEMICPESGRNALGGLALNSLLKSNLSVKYSLMGHLASSDIITCGFYDAGKARTGQRVLTLEELTQQPLNQHRPVFSVFTGSRKEKEEKQEDEIPAEETEDAVLQMLIQEAKESILQLNTEKEQYAALARLVSEAMGGAVAEEELHEFPWMLHLSELKFHLQSNVVPIGLIRKGIYCHRALLFKCLSDCIGLSCSLIRGDYNRAWNEVVLFEENPPSMQRSSRRSRFIVDLMHQPGRLLDVNTPAAQQYQTI